MNLGSFAPASTWQGVSIWPLGAGLVLSTATQLRLTELSLGPGEVLLIGWAVSALFLALTHGGLVLPSYGAPFVLFWIFSIAVLCFDLILFDLLRAHAIDPYHDFLAYLLIMLLMIAFVCRAHSVRVLLPIFVTGTVVALLAVFLVALFVSPIGPVNPWYSFRFCGWAQNPNQLAFHLSAVPFLALFLSREARRKGPKVLYALVAAGALVLGCATFSDALILAWSIAAVLYVVLDYVLSLRKRRGYWRGAARCVVLPLVALGLLLAFGPAAFDRLGEDLVARYDSGSQGSERLTLWRNGLEALMDSPVVGFGPGPQSGFYGPLGGNESHNSMIDWGTSAGLLGLLAYLALIGWLARRLWRVRDMLLMGALAAVLTMSLFHFTFRHPVFWFSLLFIAALTNRREPAPRASPCAD